MTETDPQATPDPRLQREARRPQQVEVPEAEWDQQKPDTVELVLLDRPLGDSFVGFDDEGREFRVGTSPTVVDRGAADKLIEDASRARLRIERVGNDADKDD